jgi:hypothetical protein
VFFIVTFLNFFEMSDSSSTNSTKPPIVAPSVEPLNNKIFNENIGVLGHIDSGKTSLGWLLK